MLLTGGLGNSDERTKALTAGAGLHIHATDDGLGGRLAAISAAFDAACCSYSSTCSRTQACVLGSYSPSIGIPLSQHPRRAAPRAAHHKRCATRPSLSE